ncbi:TPA: TIGR03756 family integrating conjugative element protein [Pseudomonas aeruginosa]|nr:TIGR03756 family integrating conjugative element protein [Pseudomonas aeruginosa]HBO2082076.1 TIGR03756 family integrating conjugative element protein [Pseudomonas aeruginosa]
MAALRFLSLRRSLLAGLLGLPAALMALSTADITASTGSKDCLSYRVVGICYWLFCTPYGCQVRTSTKVRHYIPDAVVSSYANTGENPWRDVRRFSPVTAQAQSGAANTAGNSHEAPTLRFKNADLIGHPGGWAFSQFAGQSGYTCAGAGTAFMPYLLSTLDTLAWRYGIPETVYPESLTPGRREIGSRAASDLWGNLYPRSGFVQQTDDYKAAAVVAQRAGDIVTRRGQVHMYQPLLADKQDGCPVLHHAPTLFHILGMVVGRADLIRVRMRELGIDPGFRVADLMQGRGQRSTHAMPGQQTEIAHTVQGIVEGVLAHPIVEVIAMDK